MHSFKFAKFLEPRIPSTTRGRLTDRLLAQGLLTPRMLNELRKEWDAQQQSYDSQHSNHNDSDNDEEGHKKLRRKRRK